MCLEDKDTELMMIVFSVVKVVEVVKRMEGDKVPGRDGVPTRLYQVGVRLRMILS